MYHRIAILGIGLIGGSLARAIALKRPDVHIAAFDLSSEALAFAVKEGFVHSTHSHAGKAVIDADIVMMATPPSAFAILAADIAPVLKKTAVVTDAGSVKQFAIDAIACHLPRQNAFVPGHPIAGSEQSGVTAGRVDLFAGKRVILTPEEAALGSEAVQRVRDLWEMTGARVEYMPAPLHDRIYAYVSHLPQLVAFAARHAMRDLPHATDEESKRFARLMQSDPALWADICVANACYIDEAIADFMAFAQQMEGELSEMPAAETMNTQPAAMLFPRVVATCLIASASLLQEVTGVHPARYAGTGFADMTAPALSDPEAALESISSHHRVIAQLLQRLLKHLKALRDALQMRQPSALISLF